MRKEKLPKTTRLKVPWMILKWYLTHSKPEIVMLESCCSHRCIGPDATRAIHVSCLHEYNNLKGLLAVRNPQSTVAVRNHRALWDHCQ